MSVISATARRVSSRGLIQGAVALLGVISLEAAAAGLPPVSIGAGTRASFTSTEVDGVADDVADFQVNSVRLYMNGSVTEELKFTFNTEFNGDNEVEVLDAIARFEFSEGFNIWAGRFLPPSDRANLYGPYYANHWGVYRDGVQDGYPFIYQGRDNGLAYWGDFGRFKVSLGAFDVPGTLNDSDVLTAARVQVNLWDLEPGYYLNGTYYGGKEILSFGVATQNVNSNSATTVDALLETKLGGGVVTLEGEYASYDGLGGYGVGGASVSTGFFGLAAYMFPQTVGIGQIQVLGKFAASSFETTGGDTDQDTLELNLNYIIKAFDARVSLFWVDTDFEGPAGTDSTQIGLGLQFQI